MLNIQVCHSLDGLPATPEHNMSIGIVYHSMFDIKSFTQSCHIPP